jgi:Asp-tRNA(Asn)/Glu-tRNA(Gln) amidotransferase C subunit
MLLTDQELHRLQTLARIKLSPEEQIKLGNQISGIISFLDKLKEINN